MQNTIKSCFKTKNSTEALLKAHLKIRRCGMIGNEITNHPNSNPLDIRNYISLYILTSTMRQ